MKKETAGLALTWDGARWPTGRLSARARAFLKRPLSAGPLTTALREGRMEEVRICWVPRLKGGKAVLCDALAPPGGFRIAFQAVKAVPFGDVLGVVYRKLGSAR